MIGPNFSRKGFHPAKILGFVLLGMFFIVLVGWIVQLLWNALLPSIFGLPSITLWQAIGLLLLSKILFGKIGSPGQSPSHKAKRWKNKWKNMSDEEKAKFREKWRERCKPRE